MAHTHDARGGRAPRPADTPFDGPLGSFLQVVVRFEDGLSRMLTPLARRLEQGPARPAPARPAPILPGPTFPGRFEAA
jgi:hypothetical protein